MTTKFCPYCEQEKDAGEFSKRAGSKDGLQAYCKPCMAICQDYCRQVRYEYYKGKAREGMVRYYQRHRTDILAKRKAAYVPRRAA